MVEAELGPGDQGPDHVAGQDARAKLRNPSRDAESVVPAIRKGEDTMSSRPFSLIRLLGANANVIDKDKDKIEYDLGSRFNKALDSTKTEHDFSFQKQHYRS